MSQKLAEAEKVLAVLSRSSDKTKDNKHVTKKDDNDVKFLFKEREAGYSARAYMMTYNMKDLNPKVEKEFWGRFYEETKQYVQYLAGQLEKCPTTGTMHWQVYIEFKSETGGRKYTWINKISESLGGGWIDCKARYGTPEQCRKYVRKLASSQGEQFEYGEFPTSTQGSRTDVRNFRNAILGGASDINLVNEHPNEVAKFPRFIPFVRNAQLHETAKNIMPVEVIALTGPSRSGKSYMVFKLYEDKMDDLYRVNNEGKWWDGYRGQPAILIDDFIDDQWRIVDMLHWLDSYPMQLPIKGGFTHKRWKRVFITSNYEIDDWYQHVDQKSRTALHKRIDVNITFSETKNNHNPIIDVFTKADNFNESLPICYKCAMNIFGNKPSTPCMDCNKP